MSWIDKIQTSLTITCGDGRTYTPLWLNASKSKEYNVNEFDFIGVTGSLVTRGTSKGRKLNLELYFQGENHLDEADRFEVSAEDSRAWTVTHPYYGEIIVQPISLTFDNKDHNVTKVIAVVVETILEENPKISVRPEDKISFDKAALDLTFELAFVNDVPTLEAKDLNQLSSNVSDAYNQGKKSIVETVDFDNYFNLFNEANTAIANAISEPEEAIRAIQAMINAPIYFVDSVKNRVNNLIGQFDLLRLTLTNLVTKTDKKIYENNMGILVSGMAEASVLNRSYNNRTDVLEIIELILGNYNQYISDIDSLQNDNGGDPDSYIPNADAIGALTDLVNFTISNLFLIAIDAKQERVIFTETDTNAILLAHRFYGLEQDDSTITKIINDNQIGLTEILQVQKGRRIVYYV